MLASTTSQFDYVRPAPLSQEKHFKPEELAKNWGVSGDTIRDLFANEPDVLLISRPETRSKRGYRTMRIPATVAERVHRKYRPGQHRAK